MPTLKVEIIGVEKVENRNPIITLKANHDFNIVRFMNINNNFDWELVATRKENHEKDVFDYQFLGQRFFQIPKSPKEMLIINNNKKYVSYKINSNEYKVECHKDDKFNWFIGFGLALSKCYGNQEKWKNAREYFRNNKKRVLDYKEYARWCVFEYFENDTIKLKEIQTKVKEINEYGKVDL